jgi:hypothetical protein
MGTPESPAALFKNWRILPNQIRDIVAATADMHPTLDDISRQAAGDAYATRWDPERTAWMRDTAHTLVDNAPQPTGPAGGGLNLSAFRDQQPPAGPSKADEEALARKFRAEIDAQFATAPEPGELEHEQPPATPGLHLSALRGDADSGPAWLPDALAAIQAAGTAGMKPSAVADLVRKDRKTVRAALQAAMERGELVYRDNGPHSVYVHPDHA